MTMPPNTKTHAAAGTWPVLSTDGVQPAPAWQPLGASTINALLLIADGHTMRSAAPKLGLSVEQVTYHIRCGLKRWKRRGRAGLMHLACQRNAIDLDKYPVVEPYRQLVPLEYRVLQHLADDRTYSRTATLLCASSTAVSKAVKGILVSLRAQSIPHAVYRAHQLDLFGLAAPATAGSAPTWRPLPTALVEVVRLVAQGMTNAEMAQALGVTRDNVKDRLKQAHIMWYTRNRAHLVHLAHERGVFRKDATARASIALEARSAG